MATCKDCIHLEACVYMLNVIGFNVNKDQNREGAEKRCSAFTDKSRFVELPCKVGDVVYYIEGAYYSSRRQTVRPIEVTEISWKCDRSGRDLWFALIANGTRYKFSSIGKTVFLTREEAEAALAERETHETN